LHFFHVIFDVLTYEGDHLQELQQREGRVRAREAELSALEQTTEAKLKMAQQKVTPHS